MRHDEYQRWVHRLAQYDPKSGVPGSPRDAIYREMVKKCVPLEDRVAINQDAIRAYNANRPATIKRPVCNWTEMPTYTGHMDDYVNQSRYVKPIDLRPGKMNWLDDLQFNNEGEKQMEKIDWHKPLRAFKTPGHEVVDAKVYTYKSGRQRVVWVDERVYPVDDQGRAVADVDYGSNGVKKGSQFVENVPEEEFFVGLARNLDGTYWLTDGGMVSDTGTMNYWKRLMTDQPHWIVDTRKSAEPPKAIVHDPKDWVALYYAEEDESAAVDDYFVTESEAKRKGAMAVRVRATPAPVDTSRYIQLYRRAGQNDAWKIDRVNGRQELAGSELSGGRGYYEYATVKVRD